MNINLSSHENSIYFECIYTNSIAGLLLLAVFYLGLFNYEFYDSISLFYE